MPIATTSYPIISSSPPAGPKTPPATGGLLPRIKFSTPPAGGVNHNAIRLAAGRMPAATDATDTAYTRAQRLVSSELNPLVQQLISGYTHQGQLGGNAIDQVTAEYAKQLAGIAPQVQSDYAGAEQGTAATNAALSQEVAGGGTADANALASRLASIGEPGAVNPVIQQLTGAAQGAGAGVYGTGSATLDALLSSGAAQQSAALKLPATAREAGLQELAQYMGSLTGAESKDVAALTDKAPGLIQSAASSIISAGSKRAAIKAEDDRNAATIAAGNARSAAAQKTAQWKVAVSTAISTGIDHQTGLLSAQGAANLRTLGLNAQQGMSVGSLTTAFDRASTTASQGAERLALQAHKDTVSANQAWARIAIAQTNADTSQGRLQLANAKQAAAAGKSSGALTQHEILTTVKGWADGKIRDTRVPWIDPTTGKQGLTNSNTPIWKTVTTTVGQVGYVQAIQGLVSTGVPVAKATAAVNVFYGNQMGSTLKEFAMTAVQHGMSPQAALALGESQGVFSRAALGAAINSVYAQVKPGDNGRPYDTIAQALPNIEENVVASIKNGQPASTVYKAAIATGVFPASLRQALVYEINKLYTQDYFQRNPGATSLPVNVLIRAA